VGIKYRSNTYKISPDDDIEVLLDSSQDRALKALLFFSGLAIIATAIRGHIQGSHPVLLVIVGFWVTSLLIYIQRSWIGTNAALIIASSIIVISQFYVFNHNGLMSAGSFILMANFSLIALIRGNTVKYFLSVINLSPLVIFVCFATLDIRLPSPEDAEKYATAFSSWLTYTVLAIIFGGIVFVNTNLLSGYLKAQSNRYRRSIFESMLVLSVMRDHETGAHLDRCTKYASTLLQACKNTGYEKSSDINLDEFTEAVRLHDIGKIGVSDNILLKEGKLTDSETTEMQKHSQLGYDMIKQISESTGIRNDPVIKLGKEIALGHHENWDGSGYPYGAPKGMYGANIPLSCRIMAIIDVYDALRSVRHYKNAYSHSEAIEIMTSMVEKKFDPKLFEVFLKVSDDFNEIFESSKE